MHISLVGINHHTAPLAIREKAAIHGKRLNESLLLLHRYLPQGIILSTCNRTEVYIADSDHRHAAIASLDFLKTHTNMTEADLQPYIYTCRDREAADHLFRVACGLDSLIIGEFEVLGQVRYALEAAEKSGMVNLPLRHIFHDAIRVGRKVREETGISQNALSASSVAVDLAATVVGDLRKSKMMIIGTGEAGRLVVKVAKERGVPQLAVASRTVERAAALAETLGGIPVTLDNLARELETVNILVACAAAPHCIVKLAHMEEAMRRRPAVPMIIIDIAVPRNVEPAVRQIENVFLYNIDDLTGISNLNRKQREEEINQAEQIIAAEVDRFATRWRDLEVRPVISAMMGKAEEIRLRQLNQTIRKLRPLSDEERERLEVMTRSIVTKILQNPIHYLKANANGKRDEVELISRLFGLDEEMEK